MSTTSSDDIYSETLGVFDQREQRYEPLTTPEVASALDANRRTVYKRLQRLVDRGELETKATGANSRVWWRPPPNSVTTTASSPAEDELTTAVTRDTTDQSECRSAYELAQTGFRRLFEQLSQPVVEIEFEGNVPVVVNVNPAFEETFGYDSAAIVGESLDTYIAPDGHEDEARELNERLISGDDIVSVEVTRQTADGLRDFRIDTATYANSSKGFGIYTDITEQKEYRRELERMQDFLGQAERLGRLGAWEFDDSGHAYWTEGTRRIHNVEEEFDPAVDTGIEFFHPEDRDTIREAVTRALEEGEPYDFEARLVAADGDERWVRTNGKPIDTDDDAQLVRGYIQEITEQKEYESRLERQREQLAALNELNNVVQSITREVIEQSTREEIKQVVCERLAGSESYEFAWVASGSSAARLQPRSECVIEGDAEDRSLPSDPGKTSLVDKAIGTLEIQVARNPTDGSDCELISRSAGGDGAKSVAVVPIVHTGTVYGVIGVHSERSDAFAQEERDVIEQVGEVVGHAIAALNRKRALLNEEMLELTIRHPDLLESREEHVQSHGTIALDRQVPAEDGIHFLYGTAPADAMHILHTIYEQQSHWVGLQTVGESGDEVRFQLKTSNPPLTSTVADHGGYFENARIEDGEFAASVFLPPGTDIRPLVERIRETYPHFEIISQQQVTRENRASRHLLENVSEKLTEKQQTTLEVAYHGGFFESPRDMSGEELAESLDIGPSTFHYHVRKGEQKLLDAVFAES